uniref:ABC transporter ATP-binding protein n=1 Tax=Ningiella ruwaisensis TaxID=2364274 RepID=UPI00109F3953|nr:ABC transporter ATP-binding protein [Ningiella ruwaisensis]
MLYVSNLCLAYSDSAVLNNINFTLQSGDIGCILGPSGCGKTTLLQAIAGFVQPKQGAINIDGRCVSDANHFISADKRGVGVVFQDFALFPHMTVQQNVEYGLQDLSKTDRKLIAKENIALVGLEKFANAYPHSLSGGQQQRVAIARAVAPKPKLLLLDEPFSSLDPELRERVAVEIRRIIKKLGITALLVTHDQNEAFAMADIIGIFAQGACQQWDNAYALYHKPASRFVANFIGESTFISGEMLYDSPNWYVNTQLGRFMLKASQNATVLANAVEGQGVEVLVRPDDITHEDASPLKATVIDKRFRGANILYRLALPNFDEQVLCLAPSHHDHELGESFGIRMSIQHVICFK